MCEDYISLEGICEDKLMCCSECRQVSWCMGVFWGCIC